MNVAFREFNQNDIHQMISIWNQIIEVGDAFPQMDTLTPETGLQFFSEQSFTGVAVNADTDDIIGVYILHPNNIGRCGHISNASYAIKDGLRGFHIGENLVKHCMNKAKELGFHILQFNAVVKTNAGALHLYKKLGFVQLGVIPNGFLLKNGQYEDIVPHYITL